MTVKESHINELAKNIIYDLEFWNTKLYPKKQITAEEVIDKIKEIADKVKDK